MPPRTSALLVLLMLALSGLLVVQGWQLRQTGMRITEMEFHLAALAAKVEASAMEQQPHGKPDAAPIFANGPPPTGGDVLPGSDPITEQIRTWAAQNGYDAEQTQQIVEIFAHMSASARQRQAAEPKDIGTPGSADDEISTGLRQAQQELVALIGGDGLNALRQHLGQTPGTHLSQAGPTPPPSGAPAADTPAGLR